jgi:hypothetical protein
MHYLRANYYKEEKEMKKKVLVLVAMMLSLVLSMSVSDVMAHTGGSGEGDDCLACWITEDVNPVYQGPLMGWRDTFGAVWLCSPTDNKGNVIPLARGGKTKCEMVIPCGNPYKVGVFERKPTSPSDIAGFCRSGLTMYDTCSSYPVIVGAYEVIDSSIPKYINDNTFTINVKMMPLQITNPTCY